jgi:hypothetical protein
MCRKDTLFHDGTHEAKRDRWAEMNKSKQKQGVALSDHERSNWHDPCFVTRANE